MTGEVAVAVAPAPAARGGSPRNMANTRDPRGHRFRSFYWRVAVSFVVFVVAVIVAQGLMFGYTAARRNAQDPSRSPNNVAAALAADLGPRLETDARLDLAGYLRTRYGRGPFRAFIVLKDGRWAGNDGSPIPPEIMQAAAAVLAGGHLTRDGRQPQLQGPVVTAPIQSRGELQGLVVLPPPPPGGVVREVGRFLSIPGTLLLIAAATVAALVVFAPARRRLTALEQAADRLGAGDLTARAPEEGGDEIAHVARSFNRMAGELAARDEALRSSDRLRRQMLADVSHELKTPLTSMRGYIETLRMTEMAHDDERRARYLATIERETQRLERIVSDLLDLARYENRVAALDARVFSIERLYQHVAQRYEREADERRIALRIEVPDAVDQVTADPDRIEQAIGNLVANAIRHTPPGGVIVLRAVSGGDAVTLSVIDTGEGIAAGHVAHVFDRFYKVDPARAGGAAGSGLGLSIVKAIVERHGGRVAVTSEPGRTEFTLVLPQHRPDVRPPT